MWELCSELFINSCKQELSLLTLTYDVTLQTLPTRILHFLRDQAVHLMMWEIQQRLRPILTFLLT